MNGWERMGCSAWEERLALFLDGELPEEEVRSLKEHLSRCPLCRIAFARQQELQAVLRRVPAPAGGDGWVEVLLARAREGAAAAGETVGNDGVEGRNENLAGSSGHEEQRAGQGTP